MASSSYGPCQAPLTWTDLLSSLRKVVNSSKALDPAQVMQIFSSYESKDEDWSKFAYFEGSGPYTRNLVDDGNGSYNLMVLAWNPNQGSCIHDHAGCSCVFKVLSGAIKEIRYDTPEEGKDLTVISEYRLRRDEVHFIEDSVGVHEMRNDTPNRAVTLHLYAPPFEVCNAFCRKTAARKPCVMSFSSVYGEVVQTQARKEDDEDMQPCC